MSDIYNMVGVEPFDTSAKKIISQHKKSPLISANGSIDPTTTKALIKEFEDEQNRKGSFHCLYPTKQSRKYDKFFESPRPLNDLLIDHIISSSSSSSASSSTAIIHDPTTISKVDKLVESYPENSISKVPSKRTVNLSAEERNLISPAFANAREPGVVVSFF
jgi:hypothetical protein